jgi:hypothetical protein
MASDPEIWRFRQPPASSRAEPEHGIGHTLPDNRKIPRAGGRVVPEIRSDAYGKP